MEEHIQLLLRAALDVQGPAPHNNQRDESTKQATWPPVGQIQHDAQCQVLGSAVPAQVGAAVQHCILVGAVQLDHLPDALAAVDDRHLLGGLVVGPARRVVEGQRGG